LSVTPGDAAFQGLKLGQTQQIVVSYEVQDEHGAAVAQSLTVTLTGTNDVPTVDAALTESADEDDALFQVNLLAGADDVDADAVLSVDNVSYAVDGGPASATAPAGVSLVGSTLSVTPGDAAFQGLKLGQTQQIVVSYEVQDEHGAAVAQSLTVTITGTNDVPVFTTGTTPRTLREHLINSTHNGFESKSVGVIAATDPDDDSLAYSITSDSSGGAFKINELTGEVLVRDISLLDFEGSGLASDVAGSYYTLRIRASDGIGYAERDVKVYLTNVTNTATDGSANFVDGDLNGNTFQLMNGNDVAFGDGGTDTLTGNNQNDWLFGGAGVDALNGSNGNDVLYGGLGTDTMTGGNDADTFVFGHGWNSGIDSITDFNSGQGDKLLLVNDYAGLFDALTAGPVPASQFSSGAGLTTATSEDVRIIYNTSTGAVYYDADGNGSAFSAVQFAVLEKVGSTNPTLTASDILVGPPPGA
ncbi:MAG TPA: VCBS domain-containing protein, partial [Burkholderiales bacterium]|nr:VCBS domain-containing protein [Burkholderiales bacterium]